ncbi:MAG: glycosyltransferase family 1 protein [Tissierellales bacterium]|nr:glycosyltransferase family 1 protein [Tissierellales bacterium]
MKLIVATYGTLGDIQPVLTLSLALQDRGHDVTLCAQPDGAEWARSHGCPYHPLGSNFEEFIKKISGHHTRNPKEINDVALFTQQEIKKQFKQLPSIVEKADLVLGSSVVFALPSIAEFFQIPYRFIATCPQFIPSNEHPFFEFSNFQMPHWVNKITWRLGYMWLNIVCKRIINKERELLGLQPINSVFLNRLGEVTIIASDPILGGIPSDKKIDCVQTGYFSSIVQGDLDDDLIRYINAGSKPIYIGFGSSVLSEKHVEKFESIVMELAYTTNQRFIVPILSSRYSQGEIKNNCYITGNVPHSLLFPNMAAVIHHGSNGTTAIASRAGIPQIIVPHFYEQFYWAHRIFKTGVGPKPINRRALSISRLTNSIKKCLDTPSYRRKATEIALHLKDQNPLDNAVQYIESINNEMRH